MKSVPPAPELCEEAPRLQSRLGAKASKNLLPPSGIVVNFERSETPPAPEHLLERKNSDNFVNSS